MLTDDLFDKTRERWESRRGARQTTDAKANVEGATPLTIDSVKRVEKYLTRRGLTEVAEAVARQAPERPSRREPPS